jgi:hypothetical protein
MSPPNEIAAWLACAAFVMMLLNQAFRLKERLLGQRQGQEIFPKPLEIKTVADPATKEYCDRNHQASSRRMESLEQALADLRQVRRDSTAKLEEQVRTLSRDIPELERRLNAATEARMAKVHDRINEVLGEVRELRGEIHHL